MDSTCKPYDDKPWIAPANHMMTIMKRIMAHAAIFTSFYFISIMADGHFWPHD